MKNCILLFMIVFASFASSQTKLISHKSHSGSDEAFAVAIENELFDIEYSNFGMPTRTENFVKLDSVICLSEDKIIRYSREYTQRYHLGKIEKCNKDELTKILKDTIIIKPKSSKQGLTVKEVQANLDSLKIYNNNLNETIYKGFDKKAKKKKSILSLFTNFPNIPNSFFLIVILSFLSVLIYFISSSLKFREFTISN